MPESPTLRERFLADLSSTNTLVVLVAIGLGLPLAGYTAMSGYPFAGSFLALVSISWDIPHIYERYWPVEYTATGALVWTIAVGLVTAAFYLGSFQLFAAVVDTTLAAVAAFLLTGVIQFGSAIAYQRTGGESV